PSDAEDYLDIYGRSFPNPKYGWTWCAVDDRFQSTSESDHYFHYYQQDFCLFRAPISEPTRVLDLKAAFGSWADAVAAAYESVDVLGIDNAPVQYATEANCRFELDDINNEWNRQWESFDLIYGHKLLGNVNDWPRLIREAFDCLAAEGFLNLRERPFRYSSRGGAIDSWEWFSQQAEELGGLVGCPFGITPGMYKGYMKDAGFLDIYETWETVPVTECLDTVLDEIECVLFRKWHREGVNRAEANMRIMVLRSQLESEASEVYSQCVTIWGRKPSAGESTVSVRRDPENSKRQQDRVSGASKRGHDEISINIDSYNRAIEKLGFENAKRLRQG
ncbi:hypothetical protein NKR23_g12270, partial [Pleurostoma richardsiae]